MNINKYLIAAMITAGVLNGAAAQNSNNKPVQSQQSYKKNGPDSWAINSAKQTQAMKIELALNDNQLKEVKRINDSHAKEIEVARVECGDDRTGLNSYIDRVSNARDSELKSVLTPEQFASFTSKKDGKNWLGMENFKYRSGDGELKVKNNKDELKIKGINNATPNVGENISDEDKINNKPDMSKNNIVIDSVTITEGVTPDESSRNQLNEKVKSEYDNMYKDSVSASNKECKEVSKKSTKSGSTHKKKEVSSKSGTKNTKSTAKVPSKSKSNVASTKSTTKKTTTAKSGSVKKKKKTTESASVKKKAKVDTCENKSSSKIVPVMPDTTSSSFNPFIAPDTTTTIIILPDTTSSASTKSPNYYINKDSKTKSTNGESKIKPTNQNKIKETDSETKSKDGNNKFKEGKNEKKVKDENLKIKINK